MQINDPSFLPHAGCEIELLPKAGEIHILLGENGLGKTTIVTHLSGSSNKSAFIEQRSMDSFYDRPLSKIKEIFFSSRPEMISKEIWDLCWVGFGLYKKEDRLQSRLSGGEGQALKLALGLSQKANIYFLDEPSQYLDHDAKGILYTIVDRLSREGKVIIIVEHDYQWIKSSAFIHELKIIDGTIKEGRVWNT